MRLEAHLLHWQEKDIMPFVVKHYQKFCDHITIWDNYSKDGSAELAQSLGCEVKQFGNRWFDDSENQKLKNNIWKGSRADWVIISDFDEILHTNTLTYLEYEFSDKILPVYGMREVLSNLMPRATILKTFGWQIMSDRMPKYDILEITNGFHFANYSKSIIFNPKEIKEINYNLGAHRCNPTGNVVWSEEPLYVMHYKHIGGLQRTIDRYKVYQKRMSPFNRKHGHGKHYNRSISSLRKEWDERMKISKPLI